MTVAPQGSRHHLRRSGMDALKTAFCALAALVALAAGAADAALLKLTPAKYTAVISLDLRRAAENRALRELLEAPESSTTPVLGETGVRLADIRELAVFNWDDHWYGAFILNSPGRFREDLERRCADGKREVVKANVAGRQVYALKKKNSGKNHRRRNKELCILFVDDDTVVIAKTAELAKFLAARREDAAERKRLADHPAAAWCVYRGENEVQKNASGRDLKKLVLDLTLTGKDHGGLELAGTAELSDPESARSMAMTLPAMTAVTAGLIFSEDPEGGDLVVKALHCEAKGNSILISMKADESLFRRFLAALRSFFKKEPGVVGKGGSAK